MSSGCCRTSCLYVQRNSIFSSFSLGQNITYLSTGFGSLDSFPSAAANVRIKTQMRLGANDPSESQGDDVCLMLLCPPPVYLNAGNTSPARRRQCSSTWFCLFVFLRDAPVQCDESNATALRWQLALQRHKAPRQMVPSQNIRFNYISLTMQLTWPLFKAAWHQMSTTEVIQINSHINVEQTFLYVFNRRRLDWFPSIKDICGVVKKMIIQLQHTTNSYLYFYYKFQ